MILQPSEIFSGRLVRLSDYCPVLIYFSPDCVFREIIFTRDLSLEVEYPGLIPKLTSNGRMSYKVTRRW